MSLRKKEYKNLGGTLNETLLLENRKKEVV